MGVGTLADVLSEQYGTDLPIASCFTRNIVSSKVIDNWVESYLTAALEVDGEKMPGRIVAARDAMADRLQDLKGNPDHHAERHEIESALAALTGLEEEASIWPTATTQLLQKKETEGAA
jgi:hypothetical protein